MEKNNQIIVYDNYAGRPLQVSFFGDHWWVTSPDETLQPLEDYFHGSEYLHFRFLCNQWGTVDAISLAKMLGKALENPFDTIDVELPSRVKELLRLDAGEGWENETVDFEWELLNNKKYLRREGKYSIRCWLVDTQDTMFDIDAFDEEEEAEEWATTYFEFLRSLKIKVNVTRKEQE